jgi:hypothetical protein
VTAAFAISMTFAMVDPPTGAKNTPRLEAEYVRFGARRLGAEHRPQPLI